jgi:hypothetical protein
MNNTIILEVFTLSEGYHYAFYTGKVIETEAENNNEIKK